MKKQSFFDEFFSKDAWICFLIPFFFVLYCLWNTSFFLTSVLVFRVLFTIVVSPPLSAVLSKIIMCFYHTDMFKSYDDLDD